MFRKISPFILFCVITLNSFAQSVNTTFSMDNEGWQPAYSGYPAQGEEGYELNIERNAIPTPFSGRNGMFFSGKNYSNRLFLFVKKEITGLEANTAYSIIFNMSIISEINPDPGAGDRIFVKVGAMTDRPITTQTGMVANNIKMGERGKSGRDMFMLGVVEKAKNTPGWGNQILHNYHQPLMVNTDNRGRLWLIVGFEPEMVEMPPFYLSSVRVVLRNEGQARAIEAMNPSKIHMYPSSTGGYVNFESDFGSPVEMVSVFTDDGHLMQVYTFQESLAEYSISTSNLSSGIYKFVFTLGDGRTATKTFSIE